MQIHDITRPLFSDDLTYPGDVSPSFRQEDRGGYRISDLHLSSHSGTHIDAPAHYLKTGATVDRLPLDALIGPCCVFDVRDAGSAITASSLATIPVGINRILLKTGFGGAGLFQPGHPHLTPDAARFLSRRGTRCVGIDSPSIEAYQCDGSVHRDLLAGGCVIIELLDLGEVEEGEYTLVALPLRLAGVDGSPARVVLITEER